MRYHPSTAILFFTRTPEEEARQKTLISAGRKTHQRIVRQLIKKTRSNLEHVGLPVYVVDSSQQIGATFGERLAHAFQSIFDRGFTNVIAVGNDTPDLSTHDIHSAQRLLSTHQAVLGPTKRGGTYLIGLHQAAFASIDFAALPWETNALFEALSGCMESANISAALIGCLLDINDPADFHVAINLLPKFSRLYKILQSVLSISSTAAVADHISRPFKRILTSYSHRAPPVHMLA